MIKKFKEFIVEGNEHLLLFPHVSDKNSTKDITKILSEEELEDQFLRLVEVFNCDVWIRGYSFGKEHRIMNSYIISFSVFPEVIDEVNMELNDVKYRIEEMFPVDIRIMKYLGMDPPQYEIGIIPRKII